MQRILKFDLNMHPCKIQVAKLPQPSEYQHAVPFEQNLSEDENI